MILTVLFWILWLLAVIGCFVPDGPNVVKGRWAVLLILLGILGFTALGNPLTK
jgi:hypothetical protein